MLLALGATTLALLIQGWLGGALIHGLVTRHVTRRLRRSAFPNGR
jgi:hypothetical protein